MTELIHQTHTGAGRDEIWLVVITALIFLTSFWLVSRPPPRVDAQPPNLALTLYYYPGAENGDSAIVASLGRGISSLAEYEQFRAAAAGPEDSASAGISINPLYWKSAFRFSSSRKPSLNDAVALRLRPDVSRLQFAPGAEYLFAFKIPAAELEDGEVLRAQFNYKFIHLASNMARVPPGAESEIEQIQNQALAAAVLGEGSDLSFAAGRLTALDKEDFSGYWYAGLALEMNDKPDEALAAYRRALGYLKIKEGTIPPYLILKRAGVLSETSAGSSSGASSRKARVP